MFSISHQKAAWFTIMFKKPAAFFFLEFMGALLHFFVNYRHQLSISGTDGSNVVTVDLKNIINKRYHLVILFFWF